MSQNEPLTERWISYFKNDYSEENHLKSFLELLLKFQNQVKHKPNIRYRFFTGWIYLPRVTKKLICGVTLQSMSMSINL